MIAGSDDGLTGRQCVWNGGLHGYCRLSQTFSTPQTVDVAQTGGTGQ